MSFRIIYIFTLAIFALPLIGQEVKLYQMPGNQIISHEIYENVATDIEKQKGIIMLYDSIHRNDTVFYRVGIKPDYSKQRNPYAKFMQMIGEDFPLDLFNIKTNGQPIFVNFWFTSCAPCIKEIPVLNELAGKYEDKAQFVAITFNTQEQVDKFLETRPINFNHITNQKTALGSFGVRSYPMNMLLDKNGKILYVDGMLNYTLWEVEMLLDKELMAKQ